MLDGKLTPNTLQNQNASKIASHKMLLKRFQESTWPDLKNLDFTWNALQQFGLGTVPCPPKCVQQNLPRNNQNAMVARCLLAPFCHLNSYQKGDTYHISFREFIVILIDLFLCISGANMLPQSQPQFHRIVPGCRHHFGWRFTSSIQNVSQRVEELPFSPPEQLAK